MNKKNIDAFGSAYLKLALQINRKFEGYLDAYWGPEQIRKEVEADPLCTPRQLQEDHRKLADLLPKNDSARHSYLKTLVDAMGFMIRKLNGEHFSYLEEVKGLFGIEPEIVPEALFLEAQNELDRYLPGKGSLSDRVKKRSEELKIPVDLLPRAVEMILDQIRPKTDHLFSLIPTENFTVDYVRKKPWRAYNTYQGNYQSRIEINLDIDRTSFGLIAGLSHEAYPGHHTELQKKESLLYKEKGFLEESCLILFIPRTIIQEGIADTGLEVIYPNLEIFQWAADVLVPALDLPPVNAKEACQMRKAMMILDSARPNVAILYHQGNLKKEQALEYLETYMMVSRRQAEQLFRFIEDPVWKTYIFTYTEGRRLMNQAAAGKDKLHLFKRLLAEQLLPEDLKKMVA